MAAAAAAAAALLLAWLLGFAASPVEETPVAGIEDIREAGLSGELVGPARAVDIVRSFETAMNRDDADTAIAVIGDEWVRLEIPGTSRGVIPRGDPATRRATVAFAAAAVDLDLGDCSASPSRLEAVADFAVVCPAAEVTGAYPEAIGRAGSGQPMVFGVADDRIISILWSGYRGDRYDTTAYCEFARAESEAAAGRAFDDECRPIEAPTALALHRNLAALYVATGRPSPEAGELAARYALPTIEHLFAAMDAGAPLGDYIDPGMILVRFPGMVLDPDVRGLPDTEELLTWVGAMYDVELGPCTLSEWSGGRVAVRCPAAEWAGPLVTSLGLDRVVQPIEFLVDDFVVTNVAGATVSELDAGFRDLCDWIRQEEPAQAKWAFEEACLPDLSATGVTALLDGAARYSAAHALAPAVTPPGS